ncbi:MAG: hypothetical protein ACPGQS_11110 [Bradymonadia bacterium]
MKNLLLIICLLLGFPIASIAQTTAPTITFNSGPTALNASTCESDLAQQLSVLVDHTETSTDNYTLQVVYYTADPTDKGECLGKLSGCPDHALDDVEACGCIAEQSVTGDSQPITVNTTLASVDGLAEFLCNGNFTVKIDVSVQLVAEGTEPIFSGMPIIIDIDVDSPEAPMIAPNLGSGEQALIVSLADESVPDDVARHEICYAPRGSINAPSDCSLNEDLTAEERTLRLYCGFTAADCRETNVFVSGNGEYRVESLLNDVEYEVVVAALDSVGNRSGNSPSSFASPAEFVDFAEGYSQLFGESQTGETGGCSTSNSGPQRIFFLFVVLLGLGRPRW